MRLFLTLGNLKPSVLGILFSEKLIIMLASIIWPLIFMSSFSSCKGVKAPVVGEDNMSITFREGYVFPYSFSEPDGNFELEDILEEISGLTVIGKNNLAAVQDENGVVFILDKEGKIVKEVKFFADGDYEGIEVVDDKLFVVKSNGDIYGIKNFGKENQDLKIFETPLNKLANIEGLGYDRINNRLLLAAKGKMSKDTTFSRAVYAFNLKTRKLEKEPFLRLDLSQIHSYLGSGKPIKYLEKINEKFDPANGGFTFAPSGIAIHPVTNNVYLISSVGKMMMVVSPEGEIIHIEKFKKKMHAQPEGICFEQNGTLWISNEGKKSAGTLVKYLPKFKK